MTTWTPKKLTPTEIYSTANTRLKDLQTKINRANITLARTKNNLLNAPYENTGSLLDQLNTLSWYTPTNYNTYTLKCPKVTFSYVELRSLADSRHEASKPILNGYNAHMFAVLAAGPCELCSSILDRCNSWWEDPNRVNFTFLSSNVIKISNLYYTQYETRISGHSNKMGTHYPIGYQLNISGKTIKNNIESYTPILFKFPTSLPIGEYLFLCEVVYSYKTHSSYYNRVATLGAIDMEPYNYPINEVYPRGAHYFYSCFLRDDDNHIRFKFEQKRGSLNNTYDPDIDENIIGVNDISGTGYNSSYIRELADNKSTGEVLAEPLLLPYQTGYGIPRIYPCNYKATGSPASERKYEGKLSPIFQAYAPTYCWRYDYFNKLAGDDQYTVTNKFITQLFPFTITGTSTEDPTNMFIKLFVNLALTKDEIFGLSITSTLFITRIK